MQFVWLGILKEGSKPDQEVQIETTSFLQQPFVPISAAGALRDDEGKRVGMMMIFEASDFEAAEALVANSPFRRAGLYREHHLFEYRNEVG
ncbi:MAG TPA: YciI family protein [Sphingomicrobium sp.]|jgi:uncharacterized protein YciI|nr:YciI family protein [Sphingomicrobium sp.]